MSGKYITARTHFATGALSWTADYILARLVSSSYSFDEDHETIADIYGKVGSPVALTNARVDSGWCLCDYLVFRDVNDGLDASAIVFHRSDGLLIEYHDAIDRFPMTLPAGEIEVTIKAPGIFRL